MLPPASVPGLALKAKPLDDTSPKTKEGKNKTTTKKNNNKKHHSTGGFLLPLILNLAVQNFDKRIS